MCGPADSYRFDGRGHTPCAVIKFEVSHVARVPTTTHVADLPSKVLSYFFRAAKNIFVSSSVGATRCCG